MKKQELSDAMGDNQYMTVDFICHDCGAEKTILCERISESELEITGGALFKPPEIWQADEYFIAKCQGCFDKNPIFAPKTEVYSRVVGYLRPVKNWNKAKKTEYSMRKEYKI